MGITSLKADDELFETAGGIAHFFPEKLRCSNYQKVFSQVQFLRYLLNSLMVALGSAVMETSLAAAAAYGLCILRWRYRSAAYWLLSLAWLVPFSVVLIPRFLIFALLPDFLGTGDFWSAWRVLPLGDSEVFLVRPLGLDSFLALILPGSISITATFILITTMARIPSQLLELAYLDTATSLGVFWRIVLPLIKPALGTVAFFAFLSSWQSFTWPLVVTSTLDMQTAPVGLRAFQSLHSTPWPLLMAGSVILTLPSLGFLFLAQRYVVDRFQLADLPENRM
jgi:multiple sugar transport system permease protein